MRLFGSHFSMNDTSLVAVQGAAVLVNPITIRIEGSNERPRQGVF